ncbi:MAG: TIGR03620 family F420-dependent LLM class oxidoreductase, partial [Actinomycetota bacterium]|nr:TIGR03620 family F420-dependent LLM class oxidoreductase [Actinomycetota bacterium]
FDEQPPDAIRAAAREIEAMGYPALWVPEGMGSREIFGHLSLLLSATERLVACSGILNVGARHAITTALGARTLAEAYPGRVVIGVGAGHEYQAEVRGTSYAKPWTRMRTYLDAMTSPEAGGDATGETAPILLAALGDRMLELAAERTLGAHTYFVPTEHTAHARERLGPDPVLAVEQTVVLRSDHDAAVRIARRFSADYLSLPNYANNLRRLGFGDEEVAGSGNERVVNATIVVGDVDRVRTRVREHLDAGADHVCVQVIDDEESDICLPALRELAPALLEL